MKHTFIKKTQKKVWFKKKFTGGRYLTLPLVLSISDAWFIYKLPYIYVQF